LWWLDGILTCLHLPIPDLRDRNGARAHLSVDASFAYGGRRFRLVASGETRRMLQDGRHRRIRAEVELRKLLVEIPIPHSRTMVQTEASAHNRADKRLRRQT